MVRWFLGAALSSLLCSPAMAGGGAGCGRSDPERPMRILRAVFAIGGLAALGGVGITLALARNRKGGAR